MDDLATPATAVAATYASLTDEILYAVDAGGRTTYLNSAAAAALQLPATETHVPLSVFVHEDDRTALQKAIARALGGDGAVAECEARLVGNLGRTTPCLHKLRSVGGGTRPIVVGVARNLSELRRLEDQLNQSQKLESIGLLAGGIAHDFNNMLAAVLGYTELALEEKTESDPDWRALTYIKISAERAAALARQLLMFGRRSRPELRPVSLSDLVRETISILERTLPRNITINVDLGDRPEHVLGDRTRLQQAVMNLCLNARDAMPEGGELAISVARVPAGLCHFARRTPRRSCPCVRVSVRDTGSGIPPEVLARLWEPFFTTKATGEGTGLGLPIVRRIMRSHDGDVTVESSPGRGTTFHLLMPAVTEAAAQVVAQSPEPPGGDENILVVDDEPVLVSLLTDMLVSKGYHVVAAANGDEALVAVSALGDRLDLVISDSMMPGLSGRELARLIHRQRPTLPFIVCSGHGQAQHPSRVEAAEVSAYVHKPYQRRELLGRVREVLDRARPAAPGV